MKKDKKLELEVEALRFEVKKFKEILEPSDLRWMRAEFKKIVEMEDKTKREKAMKDFFRDASPIVRIEKELQMLLYFFRQTQISFNSLEASLLKKDVVDFDDLKKEEIEQLNCWFRTPEGLLDLV